MATISQMAKFQDFDIKMLLEGTSTSLKKSVSLTPKMTSFAQPNWDMIPTKGGTKRSEEELERAIIELAQKEAASGILAETSARAALEKEYMSLVSPDRKAAFSKYDGVSGVVNGTELNAFGRRELMIYSSTERMWSTMPTKSELNMYSRFHEIYRNAFQAYEAEHGKVVGTPTVGPAKMNFFA